MYKIPTIEKKEDCKKPTKLIGQSGNFLKLNPSTYVVPTFPLNLLCGYKIEIFSPFVVKPSDWRLLSVVNLTDSLEINPVNSLSGLGLNKYYKKLNTIYPLVQTTNITIEVQFVIFTDILGLITDISNFIDSGCVLTEVNLTGHIANFEINNKIFTLDSTIETKTSYPIPAALKFTKQYDLSVLTNFNVYDIQTNIGQPNYVLYNNTIYNRSRTSIPLKQTFTTRSGGALLWI